LIKTLRQKQCLSQEELSELAGLSLRTIQRAESGQRVSPSSIRSLAEFFEVEVDTLEQEDSAMTKEENKFNLIPQNLTYHRAAQLIIFAIAFFVCVIQWLAYYASFDEVTDDASLGRILSIVAMISLGAAIFIYVFNMAKVTYYVSYYVTASAFLVFAIALDFWTQDYSSSATYLLYFPVFYTLLLLTLSIIHVLQLAASLKGETTYYVAK